MPSKAQLQPPAKNPKASPEPDSSTVPPAKERSEDWLGLELFLRQANNFRLALALYNDPAERDTVIREIADALEDDGIQVLALNLFEGSPRDNLLEHVKGAVEQADPNRRLVVMVVNLESRVEYAPELSVSGDPGVEFLATANLQRDLFAKVCPGPLVIWMTELLERAFVKQAPDLWHWRSHTFDFRTRPRPWKIEESRREHPLARIEQLEEELAAYRIERRNRGTMKCRRSTLVGGRGWSPAKLRWIRREIREGSGYETWPVVRFGRESELLADPA